MTPEAFWTERLIRALETLWDSGLFPDVQLPITITRAQKEWLDLTVDIFFVDETTIRELNAEWRDKDSVTDVLSFPAFDDTDDFPLIPWMPISLWELFVCTSVCASQAKQWWHSIEAETEFLLIHGLLHLLGYDHETSTEDEKRMFDIQNRLIQHLEIVSPLPPSPPICNRVL